MNKVLSLSAASLKSRVCNISVCHLRIRSYFESNPDAIIYNLGEVLWVRGILRVVRKVFKHRLVQLYRQLTEVAVSDPLEMRTDLYAKLMSKSPLNLLHLRT